jgi:hypothetical protein
MGLSPDRGRVFTGDAVSWADERVYTSFAVGAAFAAGQIRLFRRREATSSKRSMTYGRGAILCRDQIFSFSE